MNKNTPNPLKGAFRAAKDLSNSTSTEQKSPLGNRACELSAANLGVNKKQPNIN